MTAIVCNASFCSFRQMSLCSLVPAIMARPIRLSRLSGSVPLQVTYCLKVSIPFTRLIKETASDAQKGQTDAGTNYFHHYVMELCSPTKTVQIPIHQLEKCLTVCLNVSQCAATSSCHAAVTYRICCDHYEWHYLVASLAYYCSRNKDTISVI